MWKKLKILERLLAFWWQITFEIWAKLRLLWANMASQKQCLHLILSKRKRQKEWQQICPHLWPTYIRLLQGTEKNLQLWIVGQACLGLRQQIGQFGLMKSWLQSRSNQHGGTKGWIWSCRADFMRLNWHWNLKEKAFNQSHQLKLRR